MISNPATFFTNGSDQRQFTYEGGAKPFHWSPYNSGLSKSMECNVVFFANDIDHARDVLRRLFEFWIECNESYLKSKRDSKRDDHGLINSRRMEITTLRHYLAHFDDMTISEAPTNQFYKVGWASNDDLGVYSVEACGPRKKHTELLAY